MPPPTRVALLLCDWLAVLHASTAARDMGVLQDALGWGKPAGRVAWAGALALAGYLWVRPRGVGVGDAGGARGRGRGARGAEGTLLLLAGAPSRSSPPAASSWAQESMAAGRTLLLVVLLAVTVPATMQTCRKASGRKA